jgi:tRNA dimethylallyltransferase
MVSSKKVIIIVGPTAVGKTKLSLQIAQQVDCEIISADSRQVYKLMDIGTAKPNPSERQQAKHHFIDIKFPDEYYSAGMFGKEARQVINKLCDNGKLPLVVGGSGLYIRALVDGFFDEPIADAEVKRILKERVRQEGLQALYEQLNEVDPQLASQLHPNDTQRILRGLEVWQITGKPLSFFQQQPLDKADFESIFIGLTMERDRLYQKIEQRVEEMMMSGFAEEVVQLEEKGYSPELSSLQTVGYKEMFKYLKGQLSLEETVTLIKQKTRQYAKRQLTWFRSDKRICWFDVTDESVLTRIIDFVQQQLKGEK